MSLLLPDINILPTEYPLFDWADWPDSLAALVKDGPTSAFQMACWNAIVTHLAEALEEAEIAWYDGGGIAGTGDKFKYPVERTLMTDGYLYAYQFNRVVDNIYRRVPIERNWLWNYDKDYRGYIGEIHVYEFPYHTVLGITSVVYPEYFTELVYRLNQLIEIMRGTWPMIQISSSEKAKISCKRDLIVRQSVPIAPSLRSKSGFLETPLEVLPSIPIAVSRNSPVPISLDITQTTAAPISVMWQESRITTRFDGEVIRASWVDTKPVKTSSFGKALVECLVMTETGAIHKGRTTAEILLAQQPSAVTESILKLGSWVLTGINQRPSVPTAAQVAAMSRNTATAAALPSSMTETRERTHSYQTAEIGWAQIQNLQVSGKGKSETLASVGRFQGASAAAEEKSALTLLPGVKSRQAMGLTATQPSMVSRDLTVIRGRPRPAWAEKKTETSANITPETTPSASVGTAHNSEIRLGCTIGTAWEPPIWQDGGLWIRQARTIKILPDGSMDLSGSGDPIAAEEKSHITSVVVLDTGWLPPVWMDDGLYIRQVREVKVLEDGSLDLTGAGDEMAVRQGSGTRIAAALDTAWYPPVMINGGLYIQQVYEDPVQNENGELEVR